MDILTKAQAFFKKFRSMKLQLFIVLIILGCVPMTLFSNIISNRYEKKAIEVKILEITRRISQLNDRVVASNYIFDEDNQEVNLAVKLFAEQYRGRLVIVDNNYKVRMDTYSVENMNVSSVEKATRYNISEEAIAALKGTTSSGVSNNMVHLAFPIRNTMEADKTSLSNTKDTASPEQSNIVGAILVTASSQDVAHTVGS